MLQKVTEVDKYYRKVVLITFETRFKVECVVYHQMLGTEDQKAKRRIQVRVKSKASVSTEYFE